MRDLTDELFCLALEDLKVSDKGVRTRFKTVFIYTQFKSTFGMILAF